MIRLLVHRLLLVCLACILTLGVLERFNPTPPPLLVHADYEECATVKNKPLLRGPESNVDYRLGVQFNDKGIS